MTMGPQSKGGIVAFGLRYRKLVILVVTVLVVFGIYALEKMDKNEFPSFTVREGLGVPGVRRHADGRRGAQAARGFHFLI